jgi:phosphatidate phosphatase APP1
VDVGARSEVLVSDREGYLDAVLDEVHLAPGRHPVRLTPLQPVGQPASGTVHLPDPGADLVVVSDIDDTIIDSGIAHGLLATVRTALLQDASTRVPLEGAPELYRAMARDADGPERPFVYLSTSPWNLARLPAALPRAAPLPGRSAAAHRLGPRRGRACCASARRSTS